MLDANIAALFGIIILVLALNFYFMLVRMRRGNTQRKKMNRSAIEEAKQALWRDKEIARRLNREKEDAIERIKLRDETLAFYEEVRRRHSNEEVLEEYMALRRKVLGDEQAENPRIDVTKNLGTGAPESTEFQLPSE